MGFSPLRPGRKFPPDVRCDRQVSPKVVRNSGVFQSWGPSEFPSRIAQGTAPPLVSPEYSNPVKSLQMPGIVRVLRLFLWALSSCGMGLNCSDPQSVRNRLPCKGRPPTTFPIAILASALPVLHTRRLDRPSRGVLGGPMSWQACRCREDGFRSCPRRRG